MARTHAVAQWMLHEGVRDSIEYDEILGPTTDQSADPQDDAGKRREQRGTGVQRIHALIRVLGVCGAEKVAVEQPRPQVLEGDSTDAHGDDVTERGGELGAGDLGRVGRNLVPALLTAVAANDARQGRRGHRRLLGRQCEMQNLQQHEGGRVIGADEKPLDEQRQVCTDQLCLDGRGNYRQQSTADGRTPHLPVPAAITRDVVLAAVTGALHGLAREQGKVLAEQQQQTDVVERRAHQCIQQGTRRGRVFRG